MPILKERRVYLNIDCLLPVFTFSAAPDSSSKRECDQLHAVANPKDRNTEGEDLWIALDSIGGIDTLG